MKKNNEIDESLAKSELTPKADLPLTEKPITVLPLAVNHTLNNTNDTNTDINNINIYRHWNSRKIIVHKTFSIDMEKAIAKALKNYSQDEIVQAMDVYSEILKSEFYFSYKWSLVGFLGRKNGISTFMEEGSNKVNYEVWKKEREGSGAGKTHLLVALINNFVSKKKKKIVYMRYIDASTELKQNVLNGDVYQRKIRKYKNAEILVIDDLFKNGYTESDLRITSEIISHRYINNLPIMLSSEYLLKDLINIDKAIGGRIKEMSQNYLYEIIGVENNYRMKNNCIDIQV